MGGNQKTFRLSFDRIFVWKILPHKNPSVQLGYAGCPLRYLFPQVLGEQQSLLANQRFQLLFLPTFILGISSARTAKPLPV